MSADERDKLTFGKNRTGITDSSYKTSSTMNIVTREYALCDGKLLKNKKYNTTAYPQINKNSTNFANWSDTDDTRE